MPRPKPGLKRSPEAWLASVPHLIEHAVAGELLRIWKAWEGSTETAACTPPATVDLTPHLPPRKDQGQTSSCVAHSFSALAYCAINAKANGYPVVNPSEHVLYSRSGRLERPTGPLVDDGRQLSDVWAAYLADGLTPQAGPTPDGRESDVWSDDDAPRGNINLDATPAPVAEPRLVLHNISPSAPDVELQVQAALAANMPIWLGTSVGAAFEGLTPAEDAQPDAPDDPTGGGHALGIVGYRQATGGGCEYRVINSWGGSWDDAGECWASPAWLRACWELHAIGVVP